MAALNVDATLDNAAATNGKLDTFQPNTVRGRHAVTIVGYNTDKRFIVRGSRFLMLEPAYGRPCALHVTKPIKPIRSHRAVVAASSQAAARPEDSAAPLPLRTIGSLSDRSLGISTTAVPTEAGLPRDCYLCHPHDNAHLAALELVQILRRLPR